MTSLTPIPAYDRQTPMNPSTHLPASARAARTMHENRSLEMHLIPEAMARAQMRERLYEAESERRALRLIRARRLQRRAERASLRARRALAVALMQ